MLKDHRVLSLEVGGGVQGSFHQRIKKGQFANKKGRTITEQGSAKYLEANKENRGMRMGCKFKMRDEEEKGHQAESTGVHLSLQGSVMGTDKHGG